LSPGLSQDRGLASERRQRYKDTKFRVANLSRQKMEAVATLLRYCFTFVIVGPQPSKYLIAKDLSKDEYFRENLPLFS
jgi:hypothetical protein